MELWATVLVAVAIGIGIGIPLIAFFGAILIEGALIAVDLWRKLRE